MFTGLIEEVGNIVFINKSDNFSKLGIKANNIISDASIGDSISTNGVCLTITKITDTIYEADVMAETIRRSTLGSLNIGDRVNLERAMASNKRFGGHMVTGHIDGIGKIINLKNEGNSVWISISANENILKYVVDKGSIAIDGISLTVAYVDDNIFKVSIIPHTGDSTTLFNKAIGDVVNLECDIIGKYVEKFVLLGSKKSKSNINEDFLRNNGFI